jgi:hypothetical protein
VECDGSRRTYFAFAVCASARASFRDEVAQWSLHVMRAVSGHEKQASIYTRDAVSELTRSLWSQKTQPRLAVRDAASLQALGDFILSVVQ